MKSWNINHLVVGVEGHAQACHVLVEGGCPVTCDDECAGPDDHAVC